LRMTLTELVHMEFQDTVVHRIFAINLD